MLHEHKRKIIMSEASFVKKKKKRKKFRHDTFAHMTTWLRGLCTVTKKNAAEQRRGAYRAALNCVITVRVNEGRAS